MKRAIIIEDEQVHVNSCFAGIAETSRFIVLDINRLGEIIGEKIVEDNIDTPDEISDEEIYSWASSITDEICGDIVAQIEIYLEENL